MGRPEMGHVKIHDIRPYLTIFKMSNRNCAKRYLAAVDQRTISPSTSPYNGYKTKCKF